MEKRFEEKMEQRRQELEDNFAERGSFGLRRREAGTEVESLVGEGEETFFEILSSEMGMLITLSLIQFILVFGSCLTLMKIKFFVINCFSRSESFFRQFGIFAGARLFFQHIGGIFDFLR